MTSVSFHLSKCRPDDSHLGIIASSMEAFHQQTKQLPDEIQVICCPYSVTLTKILFSASFQTCTSPTSVFKKQLQTMTLNRCVIQNLHECLSFCSTVSERWSNFIPPALWFPQVRKWTIQQLRRYLTAKHGRESVRRMFEEIDNIFLFSLQSVQKVIINDKQSFELYGYDILLDRDLKPYVYLWCCIWCEAVAELKYVLIDDFISAL